MTAGSAAPSQAELDAMVISRVRRSGSSFYWGMRLMAPERRQAMYAVYAFCREVDDIVDEPGLAADKRRGLAEWRDDIAAIFEGRQPKLPLARALVGPTRDYGLEREDLLAVIDGCEMDAGDGLIRPTKATLDLYCDRVACAVGRLSVRIFGEFTPRCLDVANHQGRALQLTNILRDVGVDARMGRVYLPDELLSAHGIDSRQPLDVLGHPALAAVCRELAEEARYHYAKTRAAMADCSRRAMRPAAIMLEMYHAIFLRGEKDGWQPRGEPIRIPRAVKIWCALRHGLL